MSYEQEVKPAGIGAILKPVILLAIGLSLVFGVIIALKKSPSTEMEAASATAVASTPATAAAPTPVAEPAPAAAAAPAVEPMPVPLALSANESAVRVEGGIVKFYFASGKADLAPGAKEALDPVVQAAKQGKALVLSGFHDNTGSAKTNADLAKKRAKSVKALLMELGVPEGQMNLKKPESVELFAGADAQARRVEVSIE